jgi:hypothetical protein
MRDDAIDWPQWRALARVALLDQLRSGGRALGLGGSSEARYGPILLLLLLNFLLGIVFALLIWAGVLPFLAATAHLTFVMFTVGSAVVLEFHGLVLSPLDHERLGYLPVSSRTFFAARLASLGAYVGAIATALSLVPWVAYATAGGFAPRRGLAAIGATLLAAGATALAAIVAYTTVLGRAPERHVRTALTALQLLVGLVLYGSIMLLPRLALGAVPALLEGEPAWLFVSPGAWFASIVEVARGAGDRRHALASVVAVGASAALVLAARGRLSLEYAERLGHLAPGAGEAAAPASAARWFRSGEARAVRLLVGAQFRYDMRFRLGVLAIVPLTLVYLFTGLVDRAGGGHEDPFLLYMAALFFPAMIKNAVIRTDAYKAAWVFYASPADPAALLVALKNVVVWFFLVPYLVFAGVLLAATVPEPWMVPPILVLLGLLSHAVLMLDMVAEPALPFSRPWTAARQTTSLLLVMIVASLLAAIGPRLFMTGPIVGGLLLAGVLAWNLWLGRRLRARVERQLAGAEFDA